MLRHFQAFAMARRYAITRFAGNRLAAALLADLRIAPSDIRMSAHDRLQIKRLLAAVSKQLSRRLIPNLSNF
ncbi:hypothetical protein [Methylocystis sp. Sn-Cys]|uniref:hypothetical protein n=1 Tax=Methylocystis sp. Sn-Cys TaxID=1701263 RepID=UPI0019217D61|nr:hypothetical protein [Methylocystis sp. Sn-Cys]MBL1256215.1 hypothetical protein [Methylocystis sp. Sn-Cys]